MVLRQGCLNDKDADFPGGSDHKASAYSAGDLGQSLGREDLLEKEMATHSSILTWKIPWTEEPGRATVHVIAKSRTRLSDFTFTFLSSHSPGRSQAPLPLRRVFLCLFSFVLFFSIAFHKRLTTNFILGVLIPLPCCIQTEGFILHCNPNLKHQH